MPLGRLEKLLLAHPWAESLFAGSAKTPIRILIVADGKLDFNEGEFGLTELCRALQQQVTLWESFEITTAHRAAVASTGAQIPGFAFDKDPGAGFRPFGIDNYEEVWLFGASGQQGLQLTKSELQKLADFMNAGGGVFATGDHEDLGFAMCSQVPRVRSMRKWYFDPVPAGKLKAPEMDGPTRIDTLRRGRDISLQFSDQSDDIPQEIRPKLFPNADGKGCHPHPLLAHPDFAVTVLPDHMHEGECIIPKPEELIGPCLLEDNGNNGDEFPELFTTTDRPSPEVVAISSSAGGCLTDTPGILPVEPRCYIVIAAYDGHQWMKSPGGEAVRLGRVAVDSSFHHFVNTNLNGAGSSDSSKVGFFDRSGNPTADFEAIKKYYRNIVTWLCPPNVQISYYVNMLLGLRYMSPLAEEIRTNREFTLDYILFAGSATYNVIVEKYSASEATLCAQVLSTLLPPNTRARVGELTNPWPGPRPSASNLLLDSQVVLKTVLGSAMLGLALTLPEDVFAAQPMLDSDEPLQAMLVPLVRRGMNEGVTAFAELLQQAIQTFQVVSNTFVALD